MSISVLCNPINTMIFLGFLIFALLFCAAVIFDGFAFFFDSIAVSYILLGIAGYILLFGGKKFHLGMNTFFTFSFPADDNTAETGRFFLRLTEFTLAWGLLGMVLGTVWAMTKLDPHTIGQPIAFSLLSIIYAICLAVFLFLPIALRLSPPTLSPAFFGQTSIFQLLLAIGCFFTLRCLAVVLLFAVQTPNRLGPIQPEEFGSVIFRATFVLNPVDNSFGRYYDFKSILVLAVCWLAFRLASGKQRNWIAAPVIILIGIFWSVVNFVLMLGNFDSQMYGIGFMVSMFAALYGFLAAACFLIADHLQSRPSYAKMN
ncbi:MAG: hypothetical protein FWE67_15720 [Planctomycetaceae bacterium]|nr:hypothetical protein [Planctomycetaceae bacterium]